jgi:hypothetical protein
MLNEVPYRYVFTSAANQVTSHLTNPARNLLLSLLVSHRGNRLSNP